MFAGLVCVAGFGTLVQGGYKCLDGTSVPLVFRKVGTQFVWAANSKNWISKVQGESLCKFAGGHQLMNLQNFQQENFNELSNLMFQKGGKFCIFSTLAE